MWLRAAGGEQALHAEPVSHALPPPSFRLASHLPTHAPPPVPQVVRLHALLHEVRFPDPSDGHLSPAGEYNLRLGVMKELHPDLIATHAVDVRVWEGHAFVVEAAVSVGGRDIKPGACMHACVGRV